MPKPTANLPKVCCSYMEGHPAKVGWPFTQRLELLRSTGYVTQHADSKDRRRRLVGLTDEGHAFLAHVTASQTTWLAHAIEYALDDGERGDLAAATTLIERIAATESLPTGGDTR